MSGRRQKRRLKVGDVCLSDAGERVVVRDHERRWTNPWIACVIKDSACSAYQRDELMLLERDGALISDEIEAAS